MEPVFKHLLLPIAVLLCSTQIGMAQFAVKKLQTTDTDFSIRTNLGFGFSGPTSSFTFELRDDLGFNYDMISLLNRKVIRDKLAIPDELLTDMQKVKQKLDQELKAKLLNGIMSEVDKPAMANRFLEAEKEMRQMLSPEKQFLLEQIKIQAIMDAFGPSKFLQSSAAKRMLNLSSDSVTSIASQSEEFSRQFELESKELLAEANQQLIDELPETSRKQLEKLLSEKQQKELLTNSLFVRSVSRTKNIRRADLLGVLRRRDVRKSLKLDDELFEELSRSYKKMKQDKSSDLTKEFCKLLSDKLTEKQFKTFQKVIVEKEATSGGNVFCFCFGHTSYFLAMSKKDSRAVFEIGTEIKADMADEIVAMKSEKRTKLFDLLPEKKRARLAELIGPTDGLTNR